MVERDVSPWRGISYRRMEDMLRSSKEPTVACEPQKIYKKVYTIELRKAGCDWSGLLTFHFSTNDKVFPLFKVALDGRCRQKGDTVLATFHLNSM